MYSISFQEDSLLPRERLVREGVGSQQSRITGNITKDRHKTGQCF